MDQEVGEDDDIALLGDHRGGLRQLELFLVDVVKANLRAWKESWCYKVSTTYKLGSG